MEDSPGPRLKRLDEQWYPSRVAPCQPLCGSAHGGDEDFLQRVELRVIKRPPPDVRVVFWIRVPFRASRQTHGILEEITEAREAVHACRVNEVRDRSVEDALVVPQIEMADRLRPMNDLAFGIAERTSWIGLHREKRGSQ